MNVSQLLLLWLSTRPAAGRHWSTGSQLHPSLLLDQQSVLECDVDLAFAVVNFRDLDARIGVDEHLLLVWELTNQPTNHPDTRDKIQDARCKMQDTNRVGREDAHHVKCCSVVTSKGINATSLDET